MIKIFGFFSILTGILYQFNSIKGNIEFFSYGQVINDSILAMPFVILFMFSFFLSYKYILKFDNFLKIKNFNLLINIGLNILIIILYIFIIYLLYIFLIKSGNEILNNNIIGILVYIPIYFSLSSIVVHIYNSIFGIKYIGFFLIFISLIFYLRTLSISNDIVYRNTCFINGNDNVHIDYMNDNYIFLDNGNVIKLKGINIFIKSINCDSKNKE